MAELPEKEEKDHLSDKYSAKSTLIQIGACLVANSGYFLQGMVFGFPSIILPPLVHSDDMLGDYASVEYGSWIASAAFITAPVGCLLGGPVVDVLGRRRGLCLLNIPFLFGWLLIALVPHPLASGWPLLLGRLLTGFAGGLASSASVAYTTEVVTPRNRTAIVSLSPVMMGIGIFVSYLLAFLYQDQWLTATCFAIGVTALSCVLTPLLPESPLWLLKRKEQDKALKALMTLRAASLAAEVEAELTDMVAISSLKRSKTTWTNTFKNLGKPEAYKPMLIMHMFFVFQQLSGVSVVVVYGVQFAKDAEISDQAHLVAMSIGLVRVVANFLTVWSCDRWGRRRPAVVTSGGMSLFFLGLAAYTFLRHRYPVDFPARPWMPAVLIVFIILTSSIVYSTLLFSMLGEIFPTRVRGVCSGITSCLGYCYCFAMIKLYLLVVPEVGNTASFVFFGISALFGTGFLWIFLPETHGKSLMEIEQYFRSAKGSKEVLDSPL